MTTVNDLGISNFVTSDPTMLWQQAQLSLYSNTGIIGPSILSPSVIGTETTGVLRFITTGSSLYFKKAGWVSVVNVLGDGTYVNTGASASGPGAITLDRVVTTGDQLQMAIPAFRNTFNSTEIAAIAVQLTAKNTFGLSFDFYNQTWNVILAPNLDENGNFSYQYFGDTTLTNKDASWLIKIIYTSDQWQFTSRGLFYAFESLLDVRFFFVNSYKTIDLSTAEAVIDYVSVLKVNTIPGTTNAFGKDIRFQLYDNYTYVDGYIEPRRVKITPYDLKNTGYPDNPLAFDSIVFPNRFKTPWDISTISSPYKEFTNWEYLVFWMQYKDTDGYNYYEPVVKDVDILNYDLLSSTLSNWTVGQIGYSANAGLFYQYTSSGFQVLSDQSQYMVRVGRGLSHNQTYNENYGIDFQWRHFAPYDQRIDPAASNIMDMFILPVEYYTEVQTWLSGDRTTNFPVAPTSEDLRQQFASAGLNTVKMQSDEIVYHPVTFKLLFGAAAEPSLQASFLVVQLPTSQLSEGEIQSKVITNIDKFFQVQYWDFGETFFFTELSAYIHQQMASDVASIVMVPLNAQASFGNLFQIPCNPDEIVLSCAAVTDVQVVKNLTNTNLRIGNAN